MAIIDVFGRVSNEAVLTGAPSFAGLYFPSSSIDLNSNAVAGRFRDVGRGAPISLRMQVMEAFSGGTAASLLVTIVVSDVSDSSGFFDSSLISLASLENIAGALTLNAKFNLDLPPIPDHLLTTATGRRYLGVTYTPLQADKSVGTFAAGKITAEFGVWRDNPKPKLRTAGYTGP